MIAASGGKDALEKVGRPATRMRLGGWGITEAFTGRDVTRYEAMGIPAFYAGLMLLAKTGGALPLTVLDRMNANQRVTGHPVAIRLRYRPNRDTTGSAFYMSLLMQLIPAGNAYGLKLPASDGINAPEQYLIPPENVYVWRGDDGARRYDLTAADGSVFAQGVHERHIVHYKGPSSAGKLVGDSMIERLRNPLGIALAAQEYQGASYRSGGVPKGVLSIDEPLEVEDVITIRDQWHATYGGMENAGQIAVLDRGAKFQPTGMTHENAQFVELMQLSATDAARMLNLPPAMIGAEGASLTYANAQHNDRHFLKFSLRPWLVLIEETLNADAEFFGVQSGWEPKFDTDALVMDDISERYKNLQIAVGGPWMDRDEARESEGLPPSQQASPDGGVTNE